jgi:LDH2 family malate/lactate/ureidoglycolate dehydrogenase
VLPFGGPKGSAISFIIDILSGVLTGASFAQSLNTLENLNAVQNLGHTMVAMRTDLFLPAADFACRMDEILRMLKKSPPASGVPHILVPGEIEFATAALNRKYGLPLSAEVIKQLEELGRQMEVEFPSPTREEVRAQ